MTQPPDDAALVAGSPATDSRGNFVVPDTSALAKLLQMNALNLFAERVDAIQRHPDHADQLMKAGESWFNMLTQAATALEAKDRRIAELEVLLADCVDDMSHCGGDGFNHEGGEPIIAARAVLEPSDKGVGR